MGKGYKESIGTPILVIIIFLLTFAANMIPEDAIGLDTNPYLAVIILEFITCFLPSLLYCRLRGKEFRQKMRINAFGRRHIIYLLYSSLFLICGATLLSVLMYSLFPELFAETAVTEYASFAMNSTVFDGVYLVLAFAIMPAAAEEFLYRGIVAGEYSGKGAGLAAIMCSAMFSMSHFSLPRFPVYFFAGIVLTMVVFCTGSLLASMTVHALYNAIVLLSEKFVIHVVDKQNVSLVFVSLILIQIFLLSGAMMCREAHVIYRANGNDAIEYYKIEDNRSAAARYAEAFLTPSFMFLLILFIFMSLA